MKGVPKTPIKSDRVAAIEAPSPVMLLITSWRNHLNDNVFCVVTAGLVLALTVVIFVKFKKKNALKEEKQVEVDKLVKEDRAAGTNMRVDDEKNDSSEGQENSEDDLPWLLQEAPSEMSLTAEKKCWAEEKHSECSASDKSQESVKMMQTGTGCGDSHLSESIKILTADPD